MKSYFSLSSTVSLLGGILQIIIFLIFLQLEEGSFSNLIISINRNILGDAKSTFKMALPPILFLLASEFKAIAHEIMPSCESSTSSFYIVGVAVCSTILLRKKFLLTQALAILFISMGLSYFPGDQPSSEKLSNLFGHDVMYAYITIALGIGCYGMAFAILEHNLKRSDVSLWVRGIQLNMFVVPIALSFSVGNYYLSESPRGFFENFNIISSFFVIFLVACLMMKLFVVKVADSIFCMIAYSLAAMIIGLMKSQFSLEESLSPAKIGTGLILAGTFLYILIDVLNPALNPLGDDDESSCRGKDVQSYIIPMKLYQSVPTVSSKVKNNSNES